MIWILIAVVIFFLFRDKIKEWGPGRYDPDQVPPSNSDTIPLKNILNDIPASNQYSSNPLSQTYIFFSQWIVKLNMFLSQLSDSIVSYKYRKLLINITMFYPSGPVEYAAEIGYDDIDKIRTIRDPVNLLDDLSLQIRYDTIENYPDPGSLVNVLLNHSIRTEREGRINVNDPQSEIWIRGSAADSQAVKILNTADPVPAPSIKNGSYVIRKISKNNNAVLSEQTITYTISARYE